MSASGGCLVAGSLSELTKGASGVRWLIGGSRGRRPPCQSEASWEWVHGFSANGDRAPSGGLDGFIVPLQTHAEPCGGSDG